METYSDVIDFLRAKNIAVLSTLSKEGGTPSAATVFYHVSDVESSSFFRVYVVTRRDSRKFSNLLANPAVSIVVGTELAPYSVQMEGTAEFVEAGHGVDQLLALGGKLVANPQLGMLYAGAFFPDNPFSGITGEEFAVFRVTPTWARFMHPDAKMRKIAYSQIIG